jgi:hypothetical protein
MVLVDEVAFRGLYNGDCNEYCQKGPGRVVEPDMSWISVGFAPGENSTASTSCPFDTAEGAASGVPCHCSFPDRL